MSEKRTTFKLIATENEDNGEVLKLDINAENVSMNQMIQILSNALHSMAEQTECDPLSVFSDFANEYFDILNDNMDDSEDN